MIIRPSTRAALKVGGVIALLVWVAIELGSEPGGQQLNQSLTREDWLM